jgi:hypothetical protein
MLCKPAACGSFCFHRSAGSYWTLLDTIGQLNGGEGGIRTPDSLATMSDFESGAFNRALPPLRYITHLISMN